MTPYTKSALLIALSLAISTGGAQTPTPDPTAPSAASSPHQREATSTKATEKTPTRSTAPSAASTPHQEQVTEDVSKVDAKTRAKQEQTVKDCVSKEQAKNTTLSTDQARKSCWNQVKAHAEPK